MDALLGPLCAVLRASVARVGAAASASAAGGAAAGAAAAALDSDDEAGAEPRGAMCAPARAAAPCCRPGILGCHESRRQSMRPSLAPSTTALQARQNMGSFHHCRCQLGSWAGDDGEGLLTGRQRPWAADEGRCACRPAAAGGYEQQLALGALLAVVQELAARPAAGQPGLGLGSALADLDIGAVVGAARGAPDGAARNAALRLLTAVARAEPGGALAHVLEARAQRSRAGR